MAISHFCESTKEGEYVSKKTDIRDILLFIAGILFIVFPPGWAIQIDSFSENHEVLVNVLIMTFVVGVVLLGYFYNSLRNRNKVKRGG